MSGETTMYEELAVWAGVIRRLQALAGEMESREQDGAYVTEQIRKMFTLYKGLQADGDDIADCYSVDFEHPDNPDYKLMFDFRVYFVETKTT